MTTTLGLVEIEENQSKKHLIHNQALYQIGFWLKGVISRTTDAQPLTPSEGDAYILPSTRTGSVWATAPFLDNDVALFFNGKWTRIAPVEGPDVYVEDEDLYVAYNAVSLSYRVAASVFGLNAQTGTAYAVVVSDSGNLITMDNAAANTLTLPLHATEPMDVGSTITVVQIGAGVTTVDVEATGTLIGTFTGKAIIQKVGTDTWAIF